MTETERSIDLLETQVYDLRQVIETAKTLSLEENLSSLVTFILTTTMTQLNSSDAGLFIQPSMDSHFFVLGENYKGFNIAKEAEYALDATHPSLKFLADGNETCTLSYLEEQLKTTSGLDALIELQPELIIPLRAKSHLIGVLVLGKKNDDAEDHEYTLYEKDKILDLIPFFAMNLYTTMLIEMTTTDMMTQLKLKHYFYTVLFEKLEISVGRKVAISVLMLDIDFFKNVNDTYGHDCGDYVLKEVAKAIKSCIRSEDMAGRYGGEEFVVMLYETDMDGSMLVAERIRKTVEKLDLLYASNKLKVTISIGASSCQDKIILSAREMVNYADQALYVSKREGRNRVTFATLELIMANLQESL